MSDEGLQFMYPLEKLGKAVCSIATNPGDPRKRLGDAIGYLSSSLHQVMPEPLHKEFDALVARCTRCASTGEGTIPATVQGMDISEVDECLEQIVEFLITAAEHHGKLTLD